MSQIKTNKEIAGKKISIQCSFAAGYIEPVHDRGLIAISYNKRYNGDLKAKNQKAYGITDIGHLTGRYTISADGKLWFEAVPYDCNRAELVWFKNHAIRPNYRTEKDLPKDPDNDGPGNTLLWLAAAAALLFS